MNKEFLKSIVKEALNNIELLFENNVKDDIDLTHSINKLVLIYDDLKKVLHDRYQGLSEEHGLLIMIEQILPITLLLCNRKDKLDEEDKKEINETFNYVKNLYIKVFGEYKNKEVD